MDRTTKATLIVTGFFIGIIILGTIAGVGVLSNTAYALFSLF